MANKFLDGVLVIDAVGQIVGSSRRLLIGGIQILATNATWAITLKNDAGDIVYAASNIAGAGIITHPFPTAGLIVDTLTSCTASLYIEN